MAGRNKEKDLATLDEAVSEELLRFNRGSKQRIVDYCNEKLADDSEILDEQKNYSSWNRTLNGQKVWEGLVQELDNLWSAQVARPFEYIDEPGDDLRAWMKDFAKADWWLKVLQPDMSPATFKAWFSGRAIAQKNLDALQVKIDEWWARLKAALDIARDYTTWARVFSRDGITWASTEYVDGEKRDRNTHGLDQMLYRIIVEDQVLDRADAVEYVSEKYTRRHAGHLTMIDPADPKDPFVWGDYVGEAIRDTLAWEYEDRIREVLHEEFPMARSTMPPNGQWEQPTRVEERQWGGFQDESGTTVKNRELWGLWYRTETSGGVWDRDEMSYAGGESKIVAVSEDGVTWREPDEREAQGWETGTTEFLEALVQGQTPKTPSEAERDRHARAKRMASGRAGASLREIENNLRKAHERNDEKAIARWQAELDLIDLYR